MAIKTAAVGVTSTAAAVSTTSSDGIGHTVSVAPVDGTVYAGGSDVTTANGFPITPSTPQSFALAKGDVLWLVAASGTVNVRVIRLGADS